MPKKKEIDPSVIESRNRLINEIKRLRDENNIKQSEIAGELGITQASFSEIEKTSHTFPIENLVGIARVLKISPHRLLAIYTGEEPDKYSQKDKDLLNKIIGLIDDYRNPGNPPNVPQSLGPKPTHPSQIGTGPFETMERVDAEIDELESNKPVNKPIENKDF